MERRTITLLTLVAAAATGCANYTSYPPVERHADLVSPEFEPIPTLMARALRHANEAWAGDGADFAYNLPEGTSILVYNRVARRLDGGRPMERAGEPAFHVRSVRARGAEAEVDLLRPAGDGVYELVTLDLRYRLGGGWRVVDQRAWRIPQEPPSPSYPTAVARGPGGAAPTADVPAETPTETPTESPRGEAEPVVQASDDGGNMRPVP